MLSSVRKGQTLLETLSAITVALVLAATIFPVLSNAKEASAKSVCLFNLKQVSMAWMMYATDYDDLMCPSNYYIGDPQHYTYNEASAWWAWYNEGFPTYEVDMTRGLLQPYVKNPPILDCPAAQDIPGLGPVAYGINSIISLTNIDWFTGVEYGVSYSVVEQPSETILMGDAAYWSPYNSSLRRTIYINPGAIFGIVHGRHGQKANIAWLDGHAKTETVHVGTRGIYFEERKKYVLGDILKYPRSYQNGVSSQPSERDKYYYLLEKPTGI